MAAKKLTQSERMKEAWARRRAAAPNGVVTLKRKKKGARRSVRLIVERSPLEQAWRTSEQIAELLDELSPDLREVVIKHLNHR